MTVPDPSVAFFFRKRTAASSLGRWFRSKTIVAVSDSSRTEGAGPPRGTSRAPRQDRIPNAAAQTRIVSKARIRLDSCKSVRSFKAIICFDICEFESYVAEFSQRAVTSRTSYPMQRAAWSSAVASACAEQSTWNGVGPVEHPTSAARIRSSGRKSVLRADLVEKE